MTRPLTRAGRTPIILSSIRMRDRSRPPRGGSDWRDRVRDTLGIAPRRSSSRRTARAAPRGTYGPQERGYSSRSASYSSQARRDTQYAPYVIGFLLIIAALGGFVYVGVNWATGAGRLAALSSPPAAATPAAAIAAAAGGAAAAAAPTSAPAAAEEQIYIVKAGDNPASIAQLFRVKTEDLLALNNIEDPRSLQIGQRLKIPPVTAP
jgi:LysM repeat protein